MTAAQTKEHEDDTVNIPGETNVGGGWCCYKHFFVLILIMLERRTHARAANAVWRGRVK